MSTAPNSYPIWKNITAIFGGTFDPPHLGHKEAALGLFKTPGVKNIHIVPSKIPPHKPAFSSTLDRLEMTKLNFKNKTDNLIEIDEIEINAKANKPSHTIETLKKLQKKLDNFAFVIGTDQLSDLPLWDGYPNVLTLCHWIVLKRNTCATESWDITLKILLSENKLKRTLEPELFSISNSNNYLIIVETNAPAISSRAIRQHFKTSGTCPENSLDTKVESYILENKLYQN